MKEVDWKPFLLIPRPRYPQRYQNKYNCNINLFCWHVQKVGKKVPWSLKRWVIPVDLSFLPPPLSFLIQRKINLWK